MRLFLTLALFLALGLAPIAQSQAGFIFEAKQVGSDIHVTVTGSLNVSSPAFVFPNASGVAASANTSSVAVGAGNYDQYTFIGVTGPATVAATNVGLASSASGNMVGFAVSGSNLLLYVPVGYSGGAVNSTAVFANKTYADFGWYANPAAAQKVWTLGNGDTITAIPEPATGTVLLAGIAGLATFVRRRRG
jgi:hypothetical protein